ncbi:MAG: hypothetical protein J0665_18545 [Deltaproteobacteria bacterium]|nr:hypothetical protein [Deltaproteobacteria bacterium]
MTYEKADEILLHSSSYELMGAILELFRSTPLDFRTWLRILGENWSGCDNIFAYHKILKNFLPKEGPVVGMMSADELTAYEALPDTVTIYRGCGKKNKNGASWSLDKNIAAKFPFLNRYQVPDPILVTATVDKRQILAVKLDRNESEIITFSAKPIKREALLSPPIDLVSCNIPQNIDMPVAYV